MGSVAVTPGAGGVEVEPPGDVGAVDVDPADVDRDVDDPGLFDLPGPDVAD